MVQRIRRGEKVGEIELMSCLGEVFLSRRNEKENKEAKEREERMALKDAQRVIKIHSCQVILPSSRKDVRRFIIFSRVKKGKANGPK